MPDETPREEGPKAPPPVRNAAGTGTEPQPGRSKRPNPSEDSRASAPPGLRGQKERPAGPKMSPGTRKDRNPGPPQSARDSVTGSLCRPTHLEDLPSRTFSTGGTEWIVRLSGKAFAGVTSRSGAPLVELTFYRPEAPATPVSRTLTVGRTLEGMADEAFPGLLETARPVSSGDREMPLPEQP